MCNVNGRRASRWSSWECPVTGLFHLNVCILLLLHGLWDATSYERNKSIKASKLATVTLCEMSWRQQILKKNQKINILIVISKHMDNLIAIVSSSLSKLNGFKLPLVYQQSNGGKLPQTANKWFLFISRQMYQCSRCGSVTFLSITGRPFHNKTCIPISYFPFLMLCLEMRPCCHSSFISALWI